MRASHFRLFPLALAIVLTCAGRGEGRAASPQPLRRVPAPSSSDALHQAKPAVAPADPLPDAPGVFRALLTRYYEACSRKDLAAVEMLWHPKGPARSRRNILEVEFERQSLALVGLALEDVRADAGGGHARALVDLRVTDDKTGQKRRLRQIRDFTFLPDGTDWKIWNENADGVGARIAARLLDASKVEAEALIASDPEVRSDDALNGLSIQVNRLRLQGKLGEVLEALRLQGALARAVDNDAVLAASLQNAGLTHEVMGRFDEARKAFTEARNVFASVGTKAQLATAEGNIGNVDYVRADYPSAAEQYQKALRLFEEERDAPRTARTLHSLGNAFYMQGDFDRAMASYQRSLSMHEAAKDRYSASSVLQAIGLVHKELGNYDTAIDAFTKSAAVSAEAPDLTGEARAEQGLGDLYRLVGDYPRALQHLAASLALWERTQDAPNRATTLFATGQVYALQRNFGIAVEWYQRALDLDQKVGEKPGVARDYGGLGGAHAAAGKMDVALDEYRKSLEIRERLDDVPGAMWTTVHLGVLSTALGQHSEALESYQRALTVAEAQGDARAVATILALRSANELIREDVESALSSSGKACEIAVRQELFDTLAYAKVVAGKAHRKAGRASDAEAAFAQAIDALERVPVGPGVETFFDDRRGPYLALIDLLANENRPADAFRVAERARTRALATLLGGDGSAIVKGLSADERNRERRLAGETRTLRVRLRLERAKAKPDPERAAAIQAQLDAQKSERDAFRRTLFEKHPRLAVLRAQVDPAPLEQAASVLDPSEALLSFSVTDAQTHLIVVAGGAGTAGHIVKTARIDAKAMDLASRVAMLRDSMAHRNLRSPALTRELHTLLIEPVREALRPFHALVILPDAFLWSLPFEALQAESGRYLVQDYAVSYAPSLTALAAMRTADDTAGVSTPAAPAARPSARPFFIGVADPIITRPAQDRLALLRSAGAPTPSAAAREVRSLSMLFGAAASQSLIGEQARVDRLVGAARPSAAIHLAVPAYLVESSPLFSVIAMSPGADRDEGLGLVGIGEALSWSLPADLVMLPRLDSATGTVTGEGFVALSWSLFVAGSPTVVASRWQASPPASAETARTFYRAWIARPTPRAARPTAAAAMQKAARAVIAQPGSQPADWAGLMVIGK